MISCQHEIDIIDPHEGTIICTNCGLVKDLYFQENNKSFETPITGDLLGQVENILEQLHLPQQFSNAIKNNLYPLSSSKKFFKPKCKTYNIKKVASTIYQTVNKENSTILLKDILNLSKLTSSQIKTQDVSIVNLEYVIEKYTKRFNLSFNNNTVIKEEILKYNNTGFQPLTIIGGIIYRHLIKLNLRKSMKEVAKILGISTISIQRFLKYQNEISSRL
jgi:transcription initiation factor TFIIIB Brf1 subunit/transcription initiation factor TFIIB